MGYKEELKKAQGGGTEVPRLTPDVSFDLKENEQGEVCFAYWDKEKEKDVFVKKPMTGVLIGNAMQVKHYDAQGEFSYRSNYHFNNNHIVLFGKTSNGYSKVSEGTLEDIQTFIGDRPKRKMVLFVLTDKGFFAVSTNLSIAIDQLKKLKDQTTDYAVTLTPTLYDPDNKNISARCKQILGKLVKKNPPKFVDISIGPPLTDKYVQDIGLMDTVKMYNEWKEFNTKPGTPPVEEQDIVEHEIEDKPDAFTTIASGLNTVAEESEAKQEAVRKMTRKPVVDPKDVDKADDLPF